MYRVCFHIDAPHWDGFTVPLESDEYSLNGFINLYAFAWTTKSTVFFDTSFLTCIYWYQIRNNRLSGRDWAALEWKRFRQIFLFIATVERTGVRNTPSFQTLPSLKPWTELHSSYVNMVCTVVCTWSPDFEIMPLDAAHSPVFHK